MGKNKKVNRVRAVFGGVLCMTAAALFLSSRAGDASGSGAVSVNPASSNAKAAQAAPASKVDQILDRYIKALGGEQGIKSVHSYVMKGTLEIPSQGISGSVTAYAKAPNRYLLVEQMAGIGEMKQGFDGAAGWSEDPMNGFRRIEGDELAQLKREAEFYRDINLKTLYTSIKLVGKEQVDGKDADVLEASPPEGGTEKLYFDSQSGLLVRSDLVARSPQGEFPIQSYYGDYRKVASGMMPFSLKQVTSMATIVITISEITPNAEVADSMFSKSK